MNTSIMPLPVPEKAKRPSPMFPLLALVDRWSCDFVARCLYRSEMTIDGGDTFLHRLIQINPVDTQRAEAANASTTWSDEHVYPYLRRYHQLRRISHIAIDDNSVIPASLSALPVQWSIDKFLKHIGEPSPLFRNVHLDIANTIHLSISPSVGRHSLQSLKTLFLPKSVMWTGSDVVSTVYRTANALSKIWPDVPTRMMMPQTLPLNGCIVPSPNAWLNYIVGFLDQTETTHPSSTSKPKLPRPSIDAVIAVIKKQLIARARSSRVSLDFQFPYHDPACLARIMRAVVDVDVKDAIKAGETSRTDHRGSRAAVLKGLRLFGADAREFQA